MTAPRADDPSVERVRELLSYDPATGKFRWLVSRPGWAQAGRTAGFLHNKGYWMIGIDKRSILAHRVAWVLTTGAWPSHRIDHRDCNRLNNRWDNLRRATDGQNCQNAQIRSDSTTGFKGVSKRPSGRYRAQISHRRKVMDLGVYDTPEEAHAVYLAKAAELFGEFARSA